MSTLFGLLLMGGIWEEPGWAGYAFPRMRERFAFHKYPDLQATLLLGMLWGVWHLPLYLYGTLPWYDILIVVAIRVVYSWISNKTGESVPAAMATHYASNVFAGSTMFLVFTGSEKDTFYILYAICTCMTAFGIAWLSRFRLGRVEPQTFQQKLPLSSR
jgi:membrane protease YdiL (CAAX protease family)